MDPFMQKPTEKPGAESMFFGKIFLETERFL